jgi:hypothetical protein
MQATSRQSLIFILGLALLAVRLTPGVSAQDAVSSPTLKLPAK